MGALGENVADLHAAILQYSLKLRDVGKQVMSCKVQLDLPVSFPPAAKPAVIQSV